MANYNNASPFEKMVSPTPSDTVNLEEVWRWILVTSIAWWATLSFEAQWNNWVPVTIAMAWVAVWSVIPCLATRINTTWTTATCFIWY